MAGYTSRVFAVERALYALLVGETWPPHPITGETPLVNLGAMANPPDEVVVVAGSPASPPNQSTETNRSRAEVFTLRIIVDTWVASQEPLEVSERLEALCDVVQNALRTSGGALTNAFNGASPTQPVPGVISWAVSDSRPRHFSIDQGAVGSADIDVEFKTRI